MYYVYIVRCHDNSLYTGITNDVNRRMREHFLKLKEAANYTKSRDVKSLEALWSCENRSEATKLEYKIKQYKKEDKENLILNPDVFEDYDVVEDKDQYVKDLIE